MRTKTFDLGHAPVTLAALVALVALVAALAPGLASGKGRLYKIDPLGPCGPAGPATHDHANHKAHRSKVCRMGRLAELEVSKRAGLGQVEIRKGLAAVLSRDEGIVSLVDVKDPRKPKVLGRYDDGITDSYDGDLVFSHDGKWLFYARQTHQFSKDGVHVLDISNPKAPRLAFYQPEGGSFRIGYLRRGGNEYVITMDAIEGLVVSRFERTTGALLPVFVDPLPALKVGGPASAGVHVDPKDPKLGVPLLYATNGRTGLDIYDLSQPEAPVKLASWTTSGLADVEVRATKKSRVVFAASEYWFNSNQQATLFQLDAGKLDKIKQDGTWLGPVETGEPWRINGLEVSGKRVYVTLGHGGLVTLATSGRQQGYRVARPVNKDATLQAAPYAMDVDTSGGLVYLTDASSGILTLLKPR